MKRVIIWIKDSNIDLKNYIINISAEKKYKDVTIIPKLLLW